MKPTGPDHSTPIVVGCVALILGAFLFLQYRSSSTTAPYAKNRSIGAKPPAPSPPQAPPPAPPREPVHGGRRLSEWLADAYPRGRWPTNDPQRKVLYFFREEVDTSTPEEARTLTLAQYARFVDVTEEQRAELARQAASYAAACDALRQIGSNAIPFLVHRARYHAFGHNAWGDLDALKSAFRVLGTNAAPGLPDLHAALSTSRNTREIAGALEAIGPPAVPLLIRSLAHTNASVRAESAQALGGIHGYTPYVLARTSREHAVREGRKTFQPNGWDTVPAEWRPTNAISALVPMLQDTNRTSLGGIVARSAAITLGGFGEPAELWVPVLLQSEDDVVQTARVYAAVVQSVPGDMAQRVARHRQDMQSQHPGVRFVAAHAAYETRLPDLQPLMLQVFEQATSGTNSQFSKAASEVLAKLKQANGAK